MPKAWVGIRGKIHIEVDVSALTGPDKVVLCRHLLDDLGIVERLLQNTEETKIAQLIISEQFSKFMPGKHYV